MNYRKYPRLGTVMATALMILVFLCGTCEPASAPAANRGALSNRLVAEGFFKSDPTLAREVAESIPAPIVAHLLAGSVPSTIHVMAKCLSFAAPSSRDTVPEDMQICAFDGLDSLYVAFTQVRSGTSHIAWDTTFGFGLPQPRLGIVRLGIEGDTGVVIGMMGLVSAGGYQGYAYLLWTGNTAVLLGGVNGLWVDEKDVDGDGVVDLIAALEDEHHIDAKTGRPAIRYEVWKLSTSEMMYHKSPELTQKYLQQRMDDEK